MEPDEEEITCRQINIPIEELPFEISLLPGLDFFLAIHWHAEEAGDSIRFLQNLIDQIEEVEVEEMRKETP